MSYVYETDCVHSTGEKINAMVDQARQITWRTFNQHVSTDEVQRVFPFYSYRGEKYNPHTGELTAPMHIKKDWAVHYYKSVFDGRPCYYITHSGIEYIFTEVA